MPKWDQRNPAVTPPVRQQGASVLEHSGLMGALQLLQLHLLSRKCVSTHLPHGVSCHTPPLPSKAFRDALPSHGDWVVSCAFLFFKQVASTQLLLRTMLLGIIPKDNWSGSFGFMLTLREYIENNCKMVRNILGLLVTNLYSFNSSYRNPFPCSIDKQVLPPTSL